MAWDGFELVCIEVDEDADFDDVRAITGVGYLAPSLRRKSHEYAWWLVANHDPALFVRTDSGVARPTAETVEGRKVIQVADELSPDDPLLDLPTCDEYRSDQQLQHVE